MCGIVPLYVGCGALMKCKIYRKWAIFEWSNGCGGALWVNAGGRIQDDDLNMTHPGDSPCHLPHPPMLQLSGYSIFFITILPLRLFSSFTSSNLIWNELAGNFWEDLPLVSEGNYEQRIDLAWERKERSSFNIGMMLEHFINSYPGSYWRRNKVRTSWS
jgi:hypothetical protein